ncbi:substrate-binding periplasmic protein [Dongshaea marina]|uniref:substrate-binding periplasmic protein n=1 Tax=Dongshaea marina TaxID=2047966 RepID=UPI001900C233|nr:transporter substrate-binding domain-containing protein [Dongshaea marina]
MRRLGVFLCLMALCIGYSAQAKLQEVIVYGDANYPPYSYLEKNEAKGIYTKLLRKIFSQMKGYRVEIKLVHWRQGLELLRQGTGFALYPPYLRVKDRPYIWPYSLPLLQETVVTYCREKVLESSLRPRWPKDYYGLVIGNNSGFLVGGPEFFEAERQGKLKITEARSARENLLLLGMRKTDCYINDRHSILWELKKLKSSGEYLPGEKGVQIFEGATISTEQAFVGFTNRDNGKFSFKQDFLRQFNSILYEMQRRGELQQLREEFVR